MIHLKTFLLVEYFNRFRRGTSNGTRFGTVTGYIGDMLTSDGPALSNVFYMGQLNSSSSSNATQNMFSYYTSGHWGHYTAMRVWMHTDYYNHGYQPGMYIMEA